MAAVYDPEQLNSAEESATTPAENAAEIGQLAQHEDQVGSGYRPGNLKKSLQQRVFKTRRRVALISGGIAALLATISVIIFLSLLPFKVLHIVNNLQQHFFSSSQAALDKEVNVLETHYLKKAIIPGLKTCKAGQLTTRYCNPKSIQGNSYVTKLYKSWSTNRLERKLAINYNLEFVKSGNNYYLKVPGMDGDGARLDDSFLKSDESLDDYIQRSNDPQIKKVSRTQLRAAVRDAMDGETRYKKVWYRFKVGRLLEEKYGVRRCIVFCKATDKFDDWKGRKKDAAKAYLIDRVITPRSMALSIVLRCILDGGCSEKLNAAPPTASCGSGDCALNGQRESSWERNLRTDLYNYRSKLGREAVEDLLKKVDIIGSKGYARFLYEDGAMGADFNHESKARQNNNIQPDTSAAEKETDKKIIADSFNEEFVKKLTKGGNIVGALDTLASVFNTLGDAGPLLHKLTYVTNAGTYVQTYAMYRTYADEIKTGKVDASIVGSFTKTLNGNPGGKLKKDKYVRNIGGNAGAEQAPLYQALIDGNPRSQIGNGTLATSDKTPTYQCNNGDPLDVSKSLVCNEENLQYNESADKIQRVAENEGVAELVDVSGKWVGVRNSFFGPIIKLVNWSLEQLGKFIGSVLGILPGSDNLIKAIERWYRDLMQWMTTFLIPSPIGENTSGARMFDVAAGGADVSGNDNAHYGLGGEVLSDQTVSQIQSDQQQLALSKYSNQSFFARMFDQDSPYSPVSKLALAMPSSTGDVLRSLTDNPFGKIFHSFGSLFSFGHATAANTIGPDPFGVTQYGYDPGDSVYKVDPETYWKQNCVDPGQESSPQVSLAKDKKTYDWNSKATLNGATFMPENHETNPCLLIQAAVSSAGGIYDSSLLTDDDLGESGGSPISTAGSTVDIPDLYKSSVGIACAAGTRDIGIYDGYTNGQLVKIRLCAIPGFPSTGEESRGLWGVSGANGQGIVNSRVSGAVLALVKAAEADGVSLSAISTFRTMDHQKALCPCDGINKAKPGYSNHQMGLAIDFDGLPSSAGPIPGNQIWDWLSKNAARFDYKNYPHEAWHWSPTGH